MFAAVAQSLNWASEKQGAAPVGLRSFDSVAFSLWSSCGERAAAAAAVAVEAPLGSQ